MMSVYTITNGPEGVVQASTPICQAVGRPVTGPRATVQLPSEWGGIPDSSQGTEELNIMQAACRQPNPRVERARWVMKNAPIATSDIPREIPWDRCGKVGQPCLPQMKGGQALNTCSVCYGLKMFCTTSTSAAASRKEVEQPKTLGAVEETEFPRWERMTGEAEDKQGKTGRPPQSAAV